MSERAAQKEWATTKDAPKREKSLNEINFMLSKRIFFAVIKIHNVKSGMITITCKRGRTGDFECRRGGFWAARAFERAREVYDSRWGGKLTFIPVSASLISQKSSSTEQTNFNNKLFVLILCLSKIAVEIFWGGWNEISSLWWWGIVMKIL